MIPDEGFVENENLFFLQRALTRVSDLDLPFKNRTQLATLCAFIMTTEKNSDSPVNISTLTRNPVYRALLDGHLTKNGTGYDLEIIKLRLEVSNLRESNKRKDLYIASLDTSPSETISTHATQPEHTDKLNSNYLLKIIDLLLECFAEHIIIDADSGEFVRPYLTSSARVVVPKKIAQYYICVKNDVINSKRK